MPRKQKKYHYLYKTTNLINGKFYVGIHSTNDLNDGYLGSGTYLRNSIHRYGKENFRCEFLEFFESREILVEKEKEIVTKNFINEPLCMNLHIGGLGGPFSNIGSKRSEETKLKMSKWERTKEYGQKISMTLKNGFANGTIKSWNKGKFLTEENKAKLRGPKSEEHKKNIKIGKKNGMTDEIKNKISLAMKGKKHTEEAKMKMKKPKSEEHKKKLSLATIKYNNSKRNNINNIDIK